MASFKNVLEGWSLAAEVPHGESGEWVVEKREWVPVADFVQAFVHFGLERIDVRAGGQRGSAQVPQLWCWG